MKIEKISEHIWSLQSWMVVPVRVWAVEEEDGITLVDAGFSGMARGILRFLANQPRPLRRILLTHGHSDHVGSLPTILRHYGVPVYAHRLEIPYMEGEMIYPRRKKREYNVRKGLVQALAEREGSRLDRIGSLQPCFTPGHSPGHVVYFHEQDRVLLAGDLVTSKKGQLNRPMPMFTADMAQALRSSLIVKQLRPQRLECCHSKPVMQPAAQVEAYIASTAAAFSLSLGSFE